MQNKSHILLGASEKTHNPTLHSLLPVVFFSLTPFLHSSHTKYSCLCKGSTFSLECSPLETYSLTPFKPLLAGDLL